MKAYASANPDAASDLWSARTFDNKTFTDIAVEYGHEALVSRFLAHHHLPNTESINYEGI